MRHLVILLALAHSFFGCQPNVINDPEPACFDAAGNVTGYRMNITPVDAWPANFPVIDDGDTCGNVEHAATAQAMANAALFLANTVLGAGASVAQRVPLTALSPHADWGASIQNDPGGDPVGFAWYESTVSFVPLIFPVPTPPRAKLISFSAILKGDIRNAGVHGALPVTLPKLELIRSNPVATTKIEIVDTVTDAPASLAAYNGSHTLTKALITPHTMDPAWTYYLRFYGESGTNSAANSVGLFQLDVVYGRP